MQMTGVLHHPGIPNKRMLKYVVNWLRTPDVAVLSIHAASVGSPATEVEIFIWIMTFCTKRQMSLLQTERNVIILLENYFL